MHLCTCTALLELNVSVNLQGKVEMDLATLESLGKSRSFIDLKLRTSSDSESRPVPKNEMRGPQAVTYAYFQMNKAFREVTRTALSSADCYRALCHVFPQSSQQSPRAVTVFMFFQR